MTGTGDPPAGGAATGETMADGPATGGRAAGETGADGGGPVMLVDLLDDLVQPAPPPPVSLAPQTAGWAALAALLAAGLLGLALRWRRRRGEPAYWRAALAALIASGDDAAEVAAILAPRRARCLPARGGGGAARGGVAGLSRPRRAASRLRRRTGRALRPPSRVGRRGRVDARDRRGRRAMGARPSRAGLRGACDGAPRAYPRRRAGA